MQLICSFVLLQPSIRSGFFLGDRRLNEMKNILAFVSLLMRRKMLLKRPVGEIPRVMTPSSLFVLGVSASIGISVFDMYPIMKAYGAACIFSFPFAGLVQLVAVLCYCEMASTKPCMGGPYHYAYHLLSEFEAFLVGWVLMLCLLAGVSYRLKYISSLVDVIFFDGRLSARQNATMPLPSSVKILSESPDVLAAIISFTLAGLLSLGEAESARYILACFCACLMYLTILILISVGFGDYSIFHKLEFDRLDILLDSYLPCSQNYVYVFLLSFLGEETVAANETLPDTMVRLFVCCWFWNTIYPVLMLLNFQNEELGLRGPELLRYGMITKTGKVVGGSAVTHGKQLGGLPARGGYRKWEASSHGAAFHWDDKKILSFFKKCLKMLAGNTAHPSLVWPNHITEAFRIPSIQCELLLLLTPFLFFQDELNSVRRFLDRFDLRGLHVLVLYGVIGGSLCSVFLLMMSLERLILSMSRDGLLFQMFINVAHSSDSYVAPSFFIGLLSGLLAVFCDLKILKEIFLATNMIAAVLGPVFVLKARYLWSIEYVWQYANRERPEPGILTNVIVTFLGLSVAALGYLLCTMFRNIRNYATVLETSYPLSYIIAISCLTLIAMCTFITLSFFPQNTIASKYKIWGVPFVPIVSIFLHSATGPLVATQAYWILISWSALGLFLYFFYSITNSKEDL